MEPGHEECMDLKIPECNGSSTDLIGRYPRRSSTEKNYTEEKIIRHDLYVYCNDCKENWMQYCKIHGIFIIIKDILIRPDPNDSQRALKTTPKDWVTVKPSQIAGLGVWSIRHLPKAVRFGPYEGAILDQPNNSNYSWHLRGTEKTLPCYIDAGNEGVSNWMRYVNCARNSSEQNLIAYQYRGSIYYKTKHEIKPHTELLVWYGPSFAKELGIDLKNYHMPIKSLIPVGHFSTVNIFECQFCNKKFPSPMYLKEHENRCIMKIFSEMKIGTFKGVFCKYVLTTYDLPQKNNYCRKRSIDYYYEKLTIKSTYVGFCYKYELTTYNFQQEKNWIKKRIIDTISNNSDYEQLINKNAIEFKKRKVDIQNIQKRKHSEILLHECNVCKQQFKSKSLLDRHSIIHTEMKYYTCNLCNTVLKTKAWLKQHMVIHSGKKPYQCQDCGKSYAIKNSLISHMRNHSNEKPFKCTECGVAYKHYCSLQCHKRLHNRENTYKCTLCNQPFVRAKHLQTHLKMHKSKL